MNNWGYQTVVYEYRLPLRVLPNACLLACLLAYITLFYSILHNIIHSGSKNF